LTLLILIQFASGAITLFTLAPIVMQLVHLLLADAVWIAFVLMSVTVLAVQNETENAYPENLLRENIS
jgi:heme A synthase